MLGCGSWLRGVLVAPNDAQFNEVQLEVESFFSDNRERLRSYTEMSNWRGIERNILIKSAKSRDWRAHKTFAERLAIRHSRETGGAGLE